MLHGDRGLPRWEKLEAVVSVLALRHTPPLDPVAEASRMQEFWHAAQGHASLNDTPQNTAQVPAGTPSMPRAFGVWALMGGSLFGDVL
jgi:hypothetical protein